MPSGRDLHAGERIAALHAAVLRKHPMSLFLGSGVSRGCGLPLWDDFCSEVLERALRAAGGPIARDDRDLKRASAQFARVFRDGPLAVMRYANDLLGADFAEAVRTVLYERFVDTGKDDSLLVRLSHLIAREGVLRTVVTYNYDDLLERLLVDERGIAVQAVTEGPDLDGLDRSRGDLIMYYVHGRVPSRAGDPPSMLVASEGQYHQLRQWELGWRNLVQLHVLMSTRSLLVGLSLTDPNLRWLLETNYRETRRSHYVLDRLESPTEVLQRCKSLGIPCDVTTSKVLVDMRVDSRERLAQSLGVQFVWIRDWAELPGVLEQILS